MKNILYAFLAAVFYAINIPASKVLMRDVGPTTMAALLYLGAGIGIAILSLLIANDRKASAPLTRRDMPFVVGMVVLDIVAPIFLMLGIRYGTAANASLLGNFEIVATTVIALFVFKEAVSKRLWIAIASILLSFEGTDSFRFSYGSLLVIAATVCWGFENNCTRNCSAAEAEADEIKPFHPTVATFADGPYYEFPASQRIAEGVTYLPAPGHTTGNCIVAVETDGLFYLIHGDVTYTDVAFYKNKLSVVYDDKAAARETLDRCRAFCTARPTVWLGTHTPEALESLEQHRVVDLANPPAVIPPGEIVFKTPTGKYICSVCGYVYDPAEHDGVAFEDLPADWRCPRCKQPKEKYNRA